MQAVLIGERITGKGVVQALDHAVGVPLWEIEPLLGLLVLSLLWGALYPRKQLVPKAEGAQATERNWIADAQVLVRKLACVALAVAIVAETISGKVLLFGLPPSFPSAYRHPATHHLIALGMQAAQGCLCPAASNVGQAGWLSQVYIGLALQGALALLDIETGVETLSEVEAGAAFLIMLFLTSAEPKPKRA